MYCYIYEKSCDLPLFSVFIVFISHLVTLLPLFSFCPAATAPPGGAVCRSLCFRLWCVSQSSQFLSVLCYLCSSSSSCASSSTGHSHTFRPQIVRSIARPSSPSPLSTDAPPPASAVPSSGVEGAWPDADITPVPLLSSPDLDSLCDPATPGLSSSFPRSSPPRSATLPPPPLSAPAGTAAPAVFYWQVIDKISYITNLFRSWSLEIL